MNFNNFQGLENNQTWWRCAGLPWQAGDRGKAGSGEILFCKMYREESNDCEPQIGERIYPLDQVELAFKSLAAGGHKGKLVVRMTPEQQDPAEQAALVFRG